MVIWKEGRRPEPFALIHPRSSVVAHRYPLMVQDQTPGSKDESAVPEAQRLGSELEVSERVKALISVLSLQLFNFVAQV